MVGTINNLIANSNADISSARLERALALREKLFPYIEFLLDPQNRSIEAIEFQNQLSQIETLASRNAQEQLYKEKNLKSQILAELIERILQKPQSFALEINNPGSAQDKNLLKTILCHDFIYYGPITILFLGKILAEHEDLNKNPLLQFEKEISTHGRIAEIRINSANKIYVEAGSKICNWQIPFISNKQLVSVIERMVSETNLLHNSSIQVNASNPLVDFEHPCGYVRGAAIIAPASETPVLTLRLHPEKPYDLEELKNFGMISTEMKTFLEACQQAGSTVVIAGTMGSGKTTLLSALAEKWPSRGRKATIEDTPELKPKIDDLVKMRTLDYANEGLTNIDIASLTKACKRHSVRYVVLSEARDSAAWEILQLSQSILGCLMTYHYTVRDGLNLVDQALSTLVALCKQHPLAPNDVDIKLQVASIVQVLLLIEQDPIDHVRRVIKIYYISAYDSYNGGHFKYLELFSYDAMSKSFHSSNRSEDFEKYLQSKGVDYAFSTH